MTRAHSIVHNTSLWLIRHGEPDESVHGRCYGRLDVGLSLKGRQQMEQVAARLRDQSFAAVYTSPQRRAMESMSILGFDPSDGTKILDAFREIDFGDWEGLSYEEIARRYPRLYEEWTERPTETSFPNGESFEHMCVRVLQAVEVLRQKHFNQSVAVMTHSGVIRIIVAHVLGIPDSRLFRVAQDYGAINRIRYVGDYPCLELMNGKA
jgi:alpha-ribazole phosphatase